EGTEDDDDDEQDVPFQKNYQPLPPNAVALDLHVAQQGNVEVGGTESVENGVNEENSGGGGQVFSSAAVEDSAGRRSEEQEKDASDGNSVPVKIPEGVNTAGNYICNS